jgi:hypothetical protein
MVDFGNMVMNYKTRRINKLNNYQLLKEEHVSRNQFKNLEAIYSMNMQHFWLQLYHAFMAVSYIFYVMVQTFSANKVMQIQTTV